MTDNTMAADLREKLFGTANTAGAEEKSKLMALALRLLAAGDPITPAQLAEAAGVADIDLEHATAGRDIEYDEQGRIIGWGLTHNPTPHKFTVDGKQLYTWCAPDTLIFPILIGRTAHIESHCPTTQTSIRLTIYPDTGIKDLQPSTAVVSIADPNQLDTKAVRATGCNLQHFFAAAEAAREWRSRHPGMTVLPVAEAYTIMRPVAEAMLGAEGSSSCC